MEEYDEQIESLTDSGVVGKYHSAADVVNRALGEVSKLCVPGAKIIDLCVAGDKVINDGLKGQYTKGNIEKGVAFPTSISVNNIVGHYSPLSGDATTLVEGDVVKIDLAAQIDGFISSAACTVVATTSPNATTGNKADVICAAHFAAEAAYRLLKPGKKNTEVTEAINKIASEYKVNAVEAVLSHQMKRYVIDGNKVVISKQTLEQKVEEFEFEENEVYCIDIVMSTGEGKTKETDQKPTIFKRALDQNYSLKMKASQYLFKEINARFPTFPFALRAFDESRAKLGITECLKHDLVYTYPVLTEKQGEFVAQFKFTALIQSTGTKKLNNWTLPFVSSEHKVTDAALVQLLATNPEPSKKKKEAQPTSTDAKMDTS